MMEAAVTISDLFEKEKSACVDAYEFVDVVSKWFDDAAQTDVNALGLLVASGVFDDQTESLAESLGVSVESGPVRCTAESSNEPAPWSNTCSTETEYLKRINVTSPSGEKVAEIYARPGASNEEMDDLLLDHDFHIFLWT